MQQKVDVARLFTGSGGNPKNYKNLPDEHAMHTTIERWSLLPRVAASDLSVTRNLHGMEIFPPPFLLAVSAAGSSGAPADPPEPVKKLHLS